MSGFVYVFRLGEFYKIGRSEDAARRAEAFAMLPYPSEMIHVIASADSPAVEKALHRRFHMTRVKGEWFRLSADDLALLCAVAKADAPDDLPEALLGPALPPRRYMIPIEERIDARLDRTVKARVVAEAERRNVSLNDVVNEALALRYGLDPQAHPVPRKRMGRRPGEGRKA
jgi:predicted HicB family RNase H-like nuclease